MASTAQLVSQAMERNSALWNRLREEGTTAARVFRGQADGLSGWIVDRFGDLAWVQWREGECPLNWHEAQQMASGLIGQQGIAAVSLKRYLAEKPKAGNPGEATEKIFGDVPSAVFEVLENGMKFRIFPAETFSPGLFLDQRDNRRWIRENSECKNVLNLFAYTGGFSVAAALGGAEQVTTVDVSKKWLNEARENFRINEIPVEAHRFYADGALNFLRRAKKKGESFDLVIADPPVFSRSDADGVFSLQNDRRDLWMAVYEVLAPGGTFFFSCNWQKADRAILASETRKVFSKGSFDWLELPETPEDFRFSDNPIFCCALRSKAF